MSSDTAWVEDLLREDDRRLRRRAVLGVVAITTVVLLLGVALGFGAGYNIARRSRFEMKVETTSSGAGAFRSENTRVYVFDRQAGTVEVLDKRGKPVDPD